MARVDVKNGPEFIRFLHYIQSLVHISSDSFDSTWSAREQQKNPKSFSFNSILKKLSIGLTDLCQRAQASYL